MELKVDKELMSVVLPGSLLAARSDREKQVEVGKVNENTHDFLKPSKFSNCRNNKAFPAKYVERKRKI